MTVRMKRGGEVRVGLVGAGWVARNRHIPAIRKSGVGRLVAICDRAADTSAIPGLRGAAAYGDFQEMLRADIDAVVICTPPQTHAELAGIAIEAGKHVLVEKPFSLTSSAGREVVAMAEAAGLVVCAAHNFLFSRSCLRASQLIASGVAGEPVWGFGLQASSWRRRLPGWWSELPGGLFFDEAPHLIYLLRHFFGELQFVRSAVSTFPQVPGSSLVESSMAGEKGSARLTIWTGAPSSEWHLVVFCTRATLVLDLFRDVLIVLPPERSHGAGDVVGASARATVQHWAGTVSTGLRTLLGRQDYGAGTLMRRFLESVGGDTHRPTAPDDGWRVVKLMEDIRDGAT